MNNKGFTLIELLVVIGVIGVLTGSLAFYSRSAERQIILFRDQAKIMGALLKAKSLSISTYSEADAPCGYGVHINRAMKVIIIFKDLVNIGDNCINADNAYTGNYNCDGTDVSSDFNLAECEEKSTLDELIDFSDSTTLENIVYMPPNPDIIINDNDAMNSALIKIQIFNGTGDKTITVINNGQITTK